MSAQCTCDAHSIDERCPVHIEQSYWDLDDAGKDAYIKNAMRARGIRTCETNGHLRGHGDRCVFCKEPQPVVDFGNCKDCGAGLIMVKARSLEGQLVAICVNCDIVRGNPA